MTASATKKRTSPKKAKKERDPSSRDRNYFDALAQKAAIASGSYITFIIAAGLVIVWGISGPLFGFSDTWQLVINTSTSIITFLMVFLIQNSQSRDTQALQLKLDELIRVTHGARATLLNLEDRNNHELKTMHNKFVQIAKESEDKEGPKG